jgi:hypothetical protein
VIGDRNRATAQSADITTKAKQLKEADNKYVKALCDGSKSERNETKVARVRLQGELEKMIADGAAQAPDVQKALDGATEAGDAADKIAVNPNASDREKANAQAKFEKAKDDLRAELVKERGRIASQLVKEPGVTLTAVESCPDARKSARKEKQKATRRAERRRATPESRREPVGNQNASASARAASPVIGVGIGGVGITFGR